MPILILLLVLFILLKGLLIRWFSSLLDGIGLNNVHGLVLLIVSTISIIMIRVRSLDGVEIILVLHWGEFLSIVKLLIVIFPILRHFNYKYCCLERSGLGHAKRERA